MVGESRDLILLMHYQTHVDTTRYVYLQVMSVSQRLLELLSIKAVVGEEDPVPGEDVKMEFEAEFKKPMTEEEQKELDKFKVPKGSSGRISPGGVSS